MATSVPTGFHRVNTAEMEGPFIKGHVYFNSAKGMIYLATGTGADSLELFSSHVKNVTYNPSSETLTITSSPTASNPTGITTISLSAYAKKNMTGELSDLDTENNSSLVAAINEVLALLNSGGGKNITVTESTSQEYAKIYTIKQGEVVVGTINIPKDLVVESGHVEVNPSGQPAGTYIVLTLANAASSKVYVNVGSLVDIYTAKENATQVQVAIDPVTREISASIVADSIGNNELANNSVTRNKIRNGEVTAQKLASNSITLEKLALDVVAVLDGKLEADDITTGSANGSISVGGTDVLVKGLQQTAFMPPSQFATSSDLSQLSNLMQQYIDEKLNWQSWEE